MQARELSQVVKSALKRLLGRAQPQRRDILAARQRLSAGIRPPPPGSSDEDRCLARGYCCERGCRACPWGHGGHR